jgi:hypothetical protein
MKQLLPLICSICIIAALSCKSKNDKPGPLESLSKLKDYAENVADESKKSEARSEERRKKGDTLAIPYKELQGYLPQISSYSTEEGPKGSQMNTPGMGSWSQAEQEYKNGDKSVNVTIMDYNAAHEAFIGLTSLYGLGMSYEDDDKKQGGADLGIKDVKGYETIYKKDKRAELALVVADRFIVNLKSEGENDEGFLRGIAKSMKLEELASK